MPMSSFSLSSILSTQVITVAPETPVAEVLALMDAQRISCIVALDAGGRPAGIFTERDVIRLMAGKLSGQDLRLADAVEAPPFTVPLDIDYREAYQMMAGKGYRHLLVVDADGRLAGIVGEGDFLRHLSEELDCKQQQLDLQKRMEQSFFENERFLNTIIESEPECVKVVDKELRLLRTNRAGLTMMEADSYEQVIGQNLLGLVTPEYREPLAEAAWRIFAGEQAEIEYEIVGLKGTHRWLATNAVPLRDEKGEITAVLGITRDVTAHKLAELRILNLNRVYTMLSNINQAIIRLRDPAALYHEACRIAVENGGFRMGWVGLPDPESKALRPVACAGYYGDYLQDMQISLNDERQARNPVVRAYREGCHVCCNNIQSDTEVQLWSGQRALQLGYRSLIALPLKVKGAMRGVFALYSAQTDFFTPEEIQLLDELADDISFGMEVAEADAERGLADARLRQAAAVFESTREGVMVTDAGQNILMVNRAFTELTGYSEEEIIGQKPMLLQSGRHDRNFYTALWLSIGVTGHWQGEIWNRRKNGEVYPELLSISSVTNQDGVLTGYVGVFADISKLKASEAELEFLAHHDPLTRLPNRLLLLSRLEHGMQVARREGRQLALLMLDLDRFKDVNDSFGHLAGDELLQQVADRLTSRLRGVDTVSRLGGDEFTVLLENIAHAEDAARVADGIIDDLSEPWRLSHGSEVRIGVSVGISLFPQHGKTAEQLLQHADAALYQAKAEGRGRFKYFSDALTRAARERIGLEARLRRAIGQNELRVFYQPRVDIATGCITGAEALLRWYSAEEGLILPARFIPVAEATGQIGAIGEWVLRETCRQGRRWIEAGMEPLVLAVNVSAFQFLSGDMPAMVADILAATGFPAERLELEVTESALMEREKEVTEKLNLIRDIGVRIAIDDFGTGYSSLAYLKHFPLDVLKIDKSFISDIPDNTDDMQIAAAIVAMAHTLRVKVLAEGVETEEQLAFLRSQGCDFYQGFLKSPPLSPEAFEELLKSISIRLSN